MHEKTSVPSTYIVVKLSRANSTFICTMRTLERRVASSCVVLVNGSTRRVQIESSSI